MKRYKFPLESIRLLREQNEHAAQQRYAKALTARDAAEVQLQIAARKLAEGWELLKHELADGIAAGKIMNLRTWCLVLEIHQHERAAALAEARRVAERTFQEMVAATRDREGLDRFRDRSRRAYEHEFQREEQKNFDEMAVQSSRTPGLLEFANHEKSYHA